MTTYEEAEAENEAFIRAAYLREARAHTQHDPDGTGARKW